MASAIIWRLSLGAAPSVANTDYLGSVRLALGAWLMHVPDSITFTLLLFLILFLFRVLLRKSWLAAAAFVLLFAALKSLSSNYPAVEWPIRPSCTRRSPPVHCASDW